MERQENLIQILDNCMAVGEVSQPSQEGWFAFKFPFQRTLPIGRKEASWIFASFFAGEDGEPNWDWIPDPALAEEASAFEQAEGNWQHSSCGCGVFFGQSYRFQ